MSKDGQQTKYDLEERTAVFGEQIIEFAKSLNKVGVPDRITNQLIGAGTAIGANYCEADDAESRKDFKHKIGIAKKEARETKYWLRMCAKASAKHADTARELWKEAKELHLIFNAITNSTKRNQSNDK